MFGIDTIIDFFEGLGKVQDFFSGKDFFEISGEIWNDIMTFGSSILIKNPSKGIYADSWESIEGVYDLFGILSTSLLCIFFLYGFLKESTDLHADMTFDRTIKMFIRLILVTNLVNYIMKWIPQLLSWGTSLTKLILGKNKFGFRFNGAKVYENVAGSDWGMLVAFLTSMLFFLFTVYCAFTIIYPILMRILKIFMLVPFCGLALSTLAAGGQAAQVGYSYIKALLGTVLQALIIAVVIVISSGFVDTISIVSTNAIVVLVEYCLKMLSLSAAVKTSDQLMQKAFNL